MSLNDTCTHRRTAQDEAADTQLTADNFAKKAFKDWPNEAGFSGLEEHRGPIELRVKGSIPAWAAGALYRTGPGLNSVENTSRGKFEVSHWFDGFGHTHKFDILAAGDIAGDASSVVYSSRRQSQEFINTIKQKGWRSGISFAQRSDPCVGIFAKMTSYFCPSRPQINNNVAIYQNCPGLASDATEGHRSNTKNFVVTTDHNTIQELDPKTLTPLGSISQSQRLHPELTGPLSCAHYQKDPETGDLFNYNLAPGKTSTYRIFRVNAATGSTDILAAISEPGVPPAYIHSFFLTDNFVVLCIPSSHFSWNGLKIMWERSLLEAIKPFDKSRRCQWLVVDRRHGRGLVARFSTPAGFFFHSVNAFEEYVLDESGEKRLEICLDYVGFETTSIMTGLYYDVLLDRNDAATQFWINEQGQRTASPRFVRQRFTMPIEGQEAREAEAREVMSIPNPHAGDLPTINPAYACKPYRYVFSTCNRGLATVADALVKTDLRTGDALIWCGARGHSPGEAIFVPRPGAVDEDDGVLLSIVLDGSAQKSYLLCLDAKSMTELGKAEADFPIGIGFHGFHAGRGY
ncbi:hypothetical protein PWT90_07964 [Aphanocladium album]|nr:hypothetical protein PWT90_07964 [Aphanocladium album]